MLDPQPYLNPQLVPHREQSALITHTNHTGHVARMEEGRGVHRVLVRKPEGKETIGETQTQMGG